MRKVVTTSAAVLFFSFVLEIRGKLPSRALSKRNLKRSSDPGHLSGTPSQAFSVPAGR